MLMVLELRPSACKADYPNQAGVSGKPQVCQKIRGHRPPLFL